jgi:hypothetical protein
MLVATGVVAAMVCTGLSAAGAAPAATGVAPAASSSGATPGTGGVTVGTAEEIITVDRVLRENRARIPGRAPLQYNTTASAALQTYLNDYGANWWHTDRRPHDGAPLGWEHAPVVLGTSDKPGAAGVAEAAEQIQGDADLLNPGATHIAVAVVHPKNPGRSPVDNYWVPATQVMAIPYDYHPLQHLAGSFPTAADAAPFVGPPASPWADVSPDQAHYDEMVWMGSHDIAEGWTSPAGRALYGPDRVVTRDAMAAFLNRWNGVPAHDYRKDPAFTDVGPETQFHLEIQWMAGVGISGGWAQPDGTRTYRPTAPVRRDAMAAFLYRMAGSPAYEAPSVSPFTDVPPSTEHYKEMAWLAESGIATGWDNGDGTASYRPWEPVRRDAMAAFLHRITRYPQ